MSSSSSSLPSSSSSLSSSSLANLLIKDIERKAYVGGAFVVEQRCYFDVMNPYTRKVLGQSMNCNEEVTTIALQKAINSKWKYVDATERATKLQNWAGIVRSKSQSIAELMVLEQGKIYKEAYDEVLQGAIMMEWFAEESKRIHGEMNLNRTKNNNTNNKKDFILKQPIGIVFAITPWNFPFLGPIVKCCSAIAAGCTVILKPSEETPFTAMALALCSYDAGFIDGQFSVLPCKNPHTVSKVLLQSSDVRCVTFTGSTSIGKVLYKECAETIKRTQFELGGNAPFIVYDDADLDRAVDCAIGARFYNNGQICLGANRIYIQDTIYEEFLIRYHTKVSNLRTGNPTIGFIRDRCPISTTTEEGEEEDEKIVHTGPLINEKSLEKIKNLVDDAISKGATIMCGGKCATRATSGNGSLNYEPTILRDCTSLMAINTQEVFGPVACVYKFSSSATKTTDRNNDSNSNRNDNDVDDTHSMKSIVQIANDTYAGLAAYAFTNNQRRIWTLSEQLQAGMIGINTTDVTGKDLPFGGIKQSGYGKEGGRNCLEEYLETKVFSLGI